MEKMIGKVEFQRIDPKWFPGMPIPAADRSWGEVLESEGRKFCRFQGQDYAKPSEIVGWRVLRVG